MPYFDDDGNFKPQDPDKTEEMDTNTTSATFTNIVFKTDKKD